MAVRLGELLLRENRVTPAQLQEALNHQRTHGGRLGSTLIKLGILDEHEISTLLSRHYGVQAVQLDQYEPDAATTKLIPAETAAKYNVVPIARNGTTLTLAMADPANVFAMDDIKFMTGLHVEPVVAPETAIKEALARAYGTQLNGNGFKSGGASTDIVSKALDEFGAEDGGEAGEAHPRTPGTAAAGSPPLRAPGAERSSAPERMRTRYASSSVTGACAKPGGGEPEGS